MRKNLVNAVKLPSSNKIFGHDDDSFEKIVLCSLLEEAHKRKLPNKTKIIITDESFPENIYIPKSVKKSTTTFSALKELYKKYWHKDYSLEKATESNLESLKKQGEKIWAWLPYQVYLKENS